MEEKINDEEVDAIFKRMRPEASKINENYKAPVPEYENYDDCVEFLKQGIEVIKHNYSNFGTRKILLWLSKDEKTLYYKPIDPVKKVVAFLRGDRGMKFSNVRGFFYGPSTSTFLARRDKVLDAINYEHLHSEL